MRKSSLTPTALTPLLLFVTGCAGPALTSDAAIECVACEEWNQPQDPFRIYGNTYYVGVAGLSSILIDSGDGLVLLDGGLPQSAPLIAANIERLGFSLSDIKIIGVSHAHFDHAGGINALQRASNARVVARTPVRDALQKGDLMPDDPHYTSRISSFPAVPVVEIVHDRQVLTPGKLELTVIATPGHTPGGTSWTWQSCESDICLTVVYADSLSAVASPPFRFRSGGKSAATWIRKSAGIIANLDCDIFLAPHPFYFHMAEKIQRTEKLQRTNAENAFINNACADYAAGALEQLEKTLRQEMLR